MITFDFPLIFAVFLVFYFFSSSTLYCLFFLVLILIPLIFVSKAVFLLETEKTHISFDVDWIFKIKEIKSREGTFLSWNFLSWNKAFVPAQNILDTQGSFFLLLAENHLFILSRKPVFSRYPNEHLSFTILFPNKLHYSISPIITEDLEIFHAKKIYIHLKFSVPIAVSPVSSSISGDHLLPKTVVKKWKDTCERTSPWRQSRGLRNQVLYSPLQLICGYQSQNSTFRGNIFWIFETKGKWSES